MIMRGNKQKIYKSREKSFLMMYGQVESKRGNNILTKREHIKEKGVICNKKKKIHFPPFSFLSN